MPCRAYEFESASWRWFTNSVHELMGARDPLYARMAANSRRVEAVTESVVPLDDEGPELRLCPITVRSEGDLSVAGIIDGDLTDVHVALDAAADEMVEQTMRGCFSAISSVCDRVGNTIDASGQDMVDALIDGIERTEVDFDDDGHPTATLVIHPDTYAKLLARGTTPEQSSRLQAVYAKKLEEHRASRRVRRLD